MAGLLRGEWTKLWSVRSTWYMLGGALVAAVGIGALSAHFDVNDWDQMTAAQRAGVDPLADTLVGLLISQLVIAILGAMCITGEYSSGLIRTTLVAAPRRVAVLAAKAVALTATVLLTGIVTTLSAFAVGQAILAGRHLDVPLSHPGVVRGLAAAVGYLVAAGLVGLFLGTLLRHTGGALAVLVALLFLAPELLHGTSTLVSDISNALPGTAIRRLVTLHPWQNAPSVPLACLVIAAYPIVLLVGATLAIRSRDA